MGVIVGIAVYTVPAVFAARAAYHARSWLGALWVATYVAAAIAPLKEGFDDPGVVSTAVATALAVSVTAYKTSRWLVKLSLFLTTLSTVAFVIEMWLLKHPLRLDGIGGIVALAIHNIVSVALARVLLKPVVAYDGV